MAEFLVDDFFDPDFVEHTFSNLVSLLDDSRATQYFIVAHVLAGISKEENLSPSLDWHPKAIAFLAKEALHNAYAFDAVGLYAAKLILDERPLDKDLKYFAAAVLNGNHSKPRGRAAKPPTDYFKKIAIGLSAAHATQYSGCHLTQSESKSASVSGCEAARLLAETRDIHVPYSWVQNVFYPQTQGGRNALDFLYRTNPWIKDLVISSKSEV